MKSRIILASLALIFAATTSPTSAEANTKKEVLQVPSINTVELVCLNVIEEIAIYSNTQEPVKHEIIVFQKSHEYQVPDGIAFASLFRRQRFNSYNYIYKYQLSETNATLAGKQRGWNKRISC